MRCRPGSIAPAGFLCRITLPGTLTVGGLAIVGNFAGTRNRETAPSIARIRGFPGQPGGALLHDAGPRFSRDSGCGRIAQLVEQLTLNQRVQGSSPCAPTSRVKGLMEKIKDRWFPRNDVWEACGKLRADRACGLRPPYVRNARNHVMRLRKQPTWPCRSLSQSP